MKYTRENILEGIKHKVNTLKCPDKMKIGLVDRLALYPIEIEQNVLEWVNNQELTHVDCHGQSITILMDKWNLTDEDIPKLICGFAAFKNDDFVSSDLIWKTFMGLTRIYG